MLAVIVGKKGGKFTAKDGKAVESYKINFTSLYNDTERTGYYHVGSAVFERKCTRSIFDRLPNEDKAYDKGIVANITFDINGNIDNVDIA